KVTKEYRKPQKQMREKKQKQKNGAKKVVSDSPGLVDFPIVLVNSVFNFPDRQVMSNSVNGFVSTSNTLEQTNLICCSWLHLLFFFRGSGLKQSLWNILLSCGKGK
ncbi:unnamed protein product, partial [Porites evermanni]